MPVRRLEDRIRELCAKALYVSGAEWAATLHELQLSIQEHNLRMANMTTAATVAGKPGMFRDRRGS